MTNKQFIQSLIVLAWFLTTTTLSMFAFAFGKYAPNPDYSLWIVGTVFVNIACSVYWLCSHLNKQGGEV